MSNVWRLAIADPEAESRESLKAILLAMDDVWLEADCSRYEFFLDVVEQSTPDIAIINLDTDPDKSVRLVESVVQANSSVGVIVVSSCSDGQLILRAIRAGAKEFVGLPVSSGELGAAFARIARLRGGDTRSGGPEKGRVVVVCGTTGGVGSTSIAVNMSTILARHEANSVVLLDLDMALGDIDVFLDIIPEYTVLDLTQNISRLDLSLLRKSLTMHDSGVGLLPRPVHLQDAGSVSADDLERVISLVRSASTHLIIDISKSYSQLDMVALESADDILLVTQLDLPCLRNTVRLLSSFDEYDGMREKVKVVVNRVGLQSGQISLKKAQESIRDEIFWQVPNDYSTMVEVRNNGIPLMEQAPKAAITSAMRSMTDSLFGFTEESSSEKSKPSIGSLFSRFKGKATKSKQ